MPPPPHAGVLGKVVHVHCGFSDECGMFFFHNINTFFSPFVYHISKDIYIYTKQRHMYIYIYIYEKCLMHMLWLYINLRVHINMYDIYIFATGLAANAVTVTGRHSYSF